MEFQFAFSVGSLLSLWKKNIRLIFCGNNIFVLNEGLDGGGLEFSNQ